jgi:hypothetical protein
MKFLQLFFTSFTEAFCTSYVCFVVVLGCEAVLISGAELQYSKTLNFNFANFQSKHTESSQFLEGLFASRRLMENWHNRIG